MVVVKRKPHWPSIGSREQTVVSCVKVQHCSRWTKAKSPTATRGRCHAKVNKCFLGICWNNWCWCFFLRGYSQLVRLTRPSVRRVKDETKKVIRCWSRMSTISIILFPFLSNLSHLPFTKTLIPQAYEQKTVPSHQYFYFHLAVTWYFLSTSSSYLKTLIS